MILAKNFADYCVPGKFRHPSRNPIVTGPKPADKELLGHESKAEKPAAGAKPIAQSVFFQSDSYITLA